MTPLSLYLLIGIGTFVGVVVFLVLWRRREKRRQHAIQIANLMHKWGMEWFASVYEAYAIGNYIGTGSLGEKAVEALTIMRDDKAMLAKLAEVGRKVCAGAIKNDPALAAELLAILQPSAIVKAAPAVA